MNYPFDLENLLYVARQDTGGSRRVAQFLLSLWNGGSFRADLQAIMYIDADLFNDMLALWQYLHGSNQQLYSIVTEDQMRPIIRAWGEAFRIPD